MSTLHVDYLERRGEGFVHLSAGRRGPAGAAKVQLTPALSCWFDPVGDRLTDAWIDLDQLEAGFLDRYFGPWASALGRETGVDEVTVDDELPWLRIAGRLALLDLTRLSPLRIQHLAVWATEAGILRAALLDAGLELPAALQVEADAMVPAVLAGQSRGSLSPVLEVAASLVHDWLDPFDPRIDQVAVSRVEPPSLVSVERLLAGLRPARPREPVKMASRVGPLALYDQLWLHLPPACFPDAVFAALVSLEQAPALLYPRLRISMPRPAGLEVPLFVRLIDPDAEDGPTVVAIDAMLPEDDWWVVEMDEPLTVDVERLRIEIVSSLNEPVLSTAAFDSARGEQWAQLALAAERRSDRSEAKRYWHLAESLHRSTGDIEAASVARASARDDSTERPPFLAESDEGRSLDLEADGADEAGWPSGGSEARR